MGPASGQDCLQVWDLGAKPSLRFGGNLDRTAEWLVGLHGLGYKVFLFCLNRGESERFGELLESRMPAGTFQLMVGPLQRGFQHEGHKLVVVTSSEILERFYRTRSAPLTSRVSGPFRYAELKCGDYVVHQDYGIGRYLGLKGQDGVDCLLIEYRGGDKLYVPLLDFRKVQKYIGAEGKRPRLNSLDTRTWLATLGRVQEGVRKWMEQLLRLEAHRKVARGHAFPPDSYMEGEFARSFPYEETPDQSQAIEEVRAHLQAPYPMDHLLVGDVGFGKTEVAMRAALKCVVDFRQAAVLVPTTILAAQHARTFRDRFAGYPVRIGMLSRFNSRRETLEMLQGLREGTVDIAIGTHRLLQPDVRFKDLGLLVIDEEHRFGVRAKERLRLLKRTVDTLAMTATPIPRTLHQALSGLRSLSRIESPPLGRQPISTWVGPWDEDRVQSAVLEELAREGQVYYVHNRVRTLPARLAALKELLPQVRFGLAHGQMRAQDLDRTLWDFHNRKFDVLVSSSIIESGLDLLAVNTLIVENAQEFGLSELYQLRGRVGRERRQAWCYLFHPTDAGRVGPEGVKRLAALREFADLGSAFRLSLRDMEIRGAGDLLGIRQHGYLSAVGLEFYCELLTDEMNRMRGRLAPSEDLPLVLDLKLPAHIPEAYLPGEMERLDAYKRILACPPARERALQSELEDLSGALPEEVRNLFRLSRLKRLCQSRKLRSVVQRRGWVDVHFRPEASPRPQAVLFAARAAVKSPKPAVVEFLPSRGGDGIRVDLGSDAGQEAVEWLEGFLSRLQEIAARA